METADKIRELREQTGMTRKDFAVHMGIPLRTCLLYTSIAQIGTQNFYRIKVGVGAKPKGWDLADYVLGRFSSEERELVDKAICDAADAVEMILKDGIEAAMNHYNGCLLYTSRCV